MRTTPTNEYGYRTNSRFLKFSRMPQELLESWGVSSEMREMSTRQACFISRGQGPHDREAGGVDRVSEGSRHDPTHTPVQ